MQSSILILKPSSLGDIIHTLPAVAWIKEVHPKWRLSWLVNTEWAPLLAGNPCVDELILFPRRAFRGITGAVPFLKWVKSSVRPIRPDLALDYQGLLRTALIARFSGAKAVRGLSDAREGAGWLYDWQVRIPQGTPHAVERYLALARETLGIKNPDFNPALRFPLPPGTMPEGEAKNTQGSYVLLHPFSRGEGKSLTATQVRQICERLAPERRVIIAGRAGGTENLDLPHGCVSYLNRTNIDELIWLIRHAAFVVSVDSGPMHIAAALHRPLISIHTWSDPRKVGPYRADAWVWKGGRIFPFSERHEMGDEFYQLPPSVLRASDLDGISALALQGASDTAG